ncbi:macrophage migration inhibitory factor homolog isoform X1 [Branchiostoma floridae x Branchiostoma japonicum]
MKWNSFSMSLWHVGRSLSLAGVLQCRPFSVCKPARMPIVHIKTNLTQDQISDDFIKDTVKMVSGQVGKAESRVVVHVDAGQRMYLGGFDPFLLFEISDIDTLEQEADREKYTKVFFDFLSQKLPVKYERIEVVFHRLPANEVGQKGTLRSNIVI